ncbi:hypothetical protein PVL29_014726 [Vitis rotundifolia]|uniref:Uncharacterized protein n=1 Tax=Vitis rotundifolia TaxID=103349 RepID=A0AA38ZHV7_VITRO|nr:hypothetical protein PVL29_014726 [Vitis rotundifolia]
MEFIVGANLHWFTLDDTAFADSLSLMNSLTKTKGPNLIAKLIGLEESPSIPFQTTSHKYLEGGTTMNQKKPLFGIDILKNAQTPQHNWLKAQFNFWTKLSKSMKTRSSSRNLIVKRASKQFSVTFYAVSVDSSTSNTLSSAPSALSGEHASVVINNEGSSKRNLETPLLAPQELNDQNSQKGGNESLVRPSLNISLNSSLGPPTFLLHFPGHAVEGIEWSKSAFTFQRGQGHPQDYFGDGYRATAPRLAYGQPQPIPGYD